MVDAAGSGSGSADASIDAPQGPPFALTSPTITEGGTIPLTHVCTNKGGSNLSPQLAVANAPAGTRSFAGVLTDLSKGLVQSGKYDIRGTAMRRMLATSAALLAFAATALAGGGDYDRQASKYLLTEERPGRATASELSVRGARLQRPVPAQRAHLPVQGLRALQRDPLGCFHVDDERDRRQHGWNESGHRDADRDVHALSGGRTRPLAEGCRDTKVGA